MNYKVQTKDYNIICEYDLYTSLQNEIANNILLLYIRVYNNIIL